MTADDDSCSSYDSFSAYDSTIDDTTPVSATNLTVGTTHTVTDADIDTDPDPDPDPDADALFMNPI